jgi:long-chain acyl-CoA synthetase
LPSPRLAVDVATTFPKLLAERAQRNGSGVAFREKRFGIWQPMTWGELQGRVRNFAHGLAAMGVQAGEVVAVVGDNRPEWVISELAAQSVGACALGVYPASVGDEVVHLLAAGRVRVVIAEDQEQVDKVVELSERLPGVERVVYSDPRGLQSYARPGLVEFTAVEAMGRDWEGDHPGWLGRQVAAGHGSDIAVVCATSGTTGRPKLAMLSHANLLDMGRGFLDADPIGPDDRYLSFLPLAWIGEQVVALSCGLQAGFTVSFPEEADSQKTDLRELGPSVIFSPPRIWEDMVASVTVGVRGRSGQAVGLLLGLFGGRALCRGAPARLRSATPAPAGRLGGPAAGTGPTGAGAPSARLHRRRLRRSRSVALLPRHRSEPEAGLRPDRDLRRGRHARRRRRPGRDRGPARGGHRTADRRQR